MQSEPYDVLENGAAGRLPEQMVLFTHTGGEAGEEGREGGKEEGHLRRIC